MRQADGKPDLKWPNNKSINAETIKILKGNPTILFLFLLTALLDFFALLSLFLAPSKPFSSIIAPVIRAFWDEKYLHYPQNFVLLPKIYSHAHFLILATFGILVTGIAIKKIEATFKRQDLSTVSILGAILPKYFSLLGIWLLAFWLLSLISKVVLSSLPPNFPVQAGVSVFLAIALQALTSYLLPAILLSDKGFVSSVVEAMKFGARHLLKTSSFIGMPISVMVAFSFIRALAAPFFINNFPEGVLLLLLVSIPISMIVDLIVTSTTTFYFLKVRASS